MINPRENESRIEYLARVLHAFMDENWAAAVCTIDYDETTCDGLCLAQDFINELGVDIDE